MLKHNAFIIDTELRSMTTTDDYTPIPSKTCKSCNIEKPLIEFSKHRGNPDGLQKQCKACVSAYKKIYKVTHREQLKAAKHQQYIENREQVREKQKAYVKKNQESINAKKRAYREKNREELNAKLRIYYTENREMYAAKNKIARENNHEIGLERSRKYRESHKEEIKIWRSSEQGRLADIRNRHARRARKLKLPVEFTTNDVSRMMNYFNYSCAICGRSRGLWNDLQSDHWIPLSSPICPGTIPTNMIPLCGGMDGCNQSKKDRDGVKWLTRKFGKRKASIMLARVNAYFDWVREQDKERDYLKA